MPTKLTHYLIKKGYVTEAQCQEAVQRQVVFGGRIGTNLLELYYISEEHLLEGISYSHGVPIADLKKLTIPREIIESFPAPLALKFKVIPIDESKGQFHLAMIEPNNFQTIDEISFTTGKSVKPYVASELSITNALEKYYGATRNRTLITLPEILDKRRKTWKDKIMREIGGQTPIENSPLVSSEESVNAEEHGEDLLVTEESRLHDFTNIDYCSRALAEAHDREKIARILTVFAHSLMDHVILFNVKGKGVYGWQAIGRWDKPQNAGLLKFSINECNIVHQVTKSNEIYLGPLLYLPAHRKIFEILGGAFPEEVVALPISVLEQVVCVLLGDNSHSKSPFRNLRDLQKLTIKAAMTFEMLILKEKILS